MVVGRDHHGQSCAGRHFVVEGVSEKDVIRVAGAVTFALMAPDDHVRKIAVTPKASII